MGRTSNAEFIRKHPRYFLELLWQRLRLPDEITSLIMEYAPPKTLSISKYLSIGTHLLWINNHYHPNTKKLEITLHPKTKRVVAKNANWLEPLFRSNLKMHTEDILQLLDDSDGYFYYDKWSNLDMEFRWVKNTIKLTVYFQH